MEMLQCVRCKQKKSIEDFALRRNNTNQRQSICRSCKKSYNITWYQKNRDRHIKASRFYDKRRKQEVEKNIVQYLKNHPCVDCQEDDIIVLQFDHMHNKSFSIAVGVHRKMGWASIKKEIDKCEVRCANCHTRRTAKQLGNYRLKFV